MHINLYGVTIIYLLMISEMIESIFGELSLPSNLTYCIFIPIIVIILTPLMWLGSPSEFWPAAYLALTTISIGLILLVIHLFLDARQFTSKSEYLAPNFSSFQEQFYLDSLGFCFFSCLSRLAVITLTAVKSTSIY